MRRLLEIVLLCSTVIAIVFETAVYLNHGRVVQKPWDAIFRQHMRLLNLITSIQWWLSEQEDVRFHLDGRTFSGPALRTLFLTTDCGKRTPDLLDDPFGKDMQDHWGRAVLVKFEQYAKPASFLHITAWSVGPNGVDEGGLGDDIKEERDFK